MLGVKEKNLYGVVEVEKEKEMILMNRMNEGLEVWMGRIKRKEEVKKMY
jgi:hypothetical protein